MAQPVGLLPSLPPQATRPFLLGPAQPFPRPRRREPPPPSRLGSLIHRARLSAPSPTPCRKREDLSLIPTPLNQIPSLAPIFSVVRRDFHAELLYKSHPLPSHSFPIYARHRLAQSLQRRHNPSSPRRARGSTFWCSIASVSPLSCFASISRSSRAFFPFFFLAFG